MRMPVRWPAVPQVRTTHELPPGPARLAEAEGFFWCYDDDGDHDHGLHHDHHLRCISPEAGRVAHQPAPSRWARDDGDADRGDGEDEENRRVTPKRGRAKRLLRSPSPAQGQGSPKPPPLRPPRCHHHQHSHHPGDPVHRRRQHARVLLSCLLQILRADSGTGWTPVHTKKVSNDHHDRHRTMKMMSLPKQNRSPVNVQAMRFGWIRFRARACRG